jgi:hypothetical protein
MTFDNGREFFVNWNRTDFLFGSMQKLKKNYSSLVKNTKTDRSKKRLTFLRGRCFIMTGTIAAVSITFIDPVSKDSCHLN